MTVIAYKNGIMACDGMAADINSGNIWFKGKKIYRTKAGGLVGCSGQCDARAIVKLLNNVKNGHQMPAAKQVAETKVESENGILVVLPNGEVWCLVNVYDTDGHIWAADVCRITGFNGAAVAGCGGTIALAAMQSGKSAKEAVALACEMNAFCGPPIYVERLHPPKASKKRPTRRR